MNVGEREQQYNYGLRRIKELLKGYGFVDLQVKRFTRDEWSIQFARRYDGWVNAAWDTQATNPVWDEPWLPVSEVRKQYPEIWQVFRERICSQTTLSHTGIGAIINSKGEHISGTTAGPSLQIAPGRPKKKSRVNAAVDELASLKEEEVIPSIQEENVLIDLTEVPTPPATPPHDNFAADGWRADDPGADFQDSGVIDLTLKDTIDLTKDTVISLDDDDASEEPSFRQTTASGAPSDPNRRPSVQQGDSDNDSLFDGPELEDEGQKLGENEMLWHLTPNSFQSNLQDIQPVQTNKAPATSNLRKFKKGRKRALDFDEDVPSLFSGHAQETPRKKRLTSNGVLVPSLLTAVRGRVVERSRNGEYRIFNAHSSAGSALAAKTMQRNDASDAGSITPQQGMAAPSHNVHRQPVTNPEELEDYEDEDELVALPNENPVLDPEIQALRDKWEQVEKPISYHEPISHLLFVRPSLPAPEQNAPPLFLLPVTKNRALRLMPRNWSLPQAQWYLSPNIKKEEDAFDTLPEVQAGVSARTDTRWKQHKVHLPTLLPEYHDLAWRASLKRQEDLRNAISRAELRRDMDAAIQFESQMRAELASSWRHGEKERTRIIPRVAGLDAAESILFNAYDGNQTIPLDEPLKRKVGSWAELVLFQHGSEVPGKIDKDAYEELAHSLEKQSKFLVISNALVDEHHAHPHTLLVFAARSRTLGELCGFPEDMMKKRRSLVVVHIGRPLTGTNLPVFMK